MKKFVIAAVLAAGVAVLASAALGSTKTPARTTSAGVATVKCGSTRTIGLAAPITGPAAAIGNQQVRWAKYYVKRWNAVKANKNKRIKVDLGRHAARRRHGVRGQGRQVVRLELEGARRRRAGR